LKKPHEIALFKDTRLLNLLISEQLDSKAIVEFLEKTIYSFFKSEFVRLAHPQNFGEAVQAANGLVFDGLDFGEKIVLELYGKSSCRLKIKL
jgi:hypothetical protein